MRASRHALRSSRSGRHAAALLDSVPDQRCRERVDAFNHFDIATFSRSPRPHPASVEPGDQYSTSRIFTSGCPQSARHGSLSPLWGSGTWHRRRVGGFLRVHVRVRRLTSADREFLDQQSQPVATVHELPRFRLEIGFCRFPLAVAGATPFTSAEQHPPGGQSRGRRS